jgi:hypothetical protein
MVVVGSSVAASSIITDYPILGGQAGRYALGAAVLAAVGRGRFPARALRRFLACWPLRPRAWPGSTSSSSPPCGRPTPAVSG